MSNINIKLVILLAYIITVWGKPIHKTSHLDQTQTLLYLFKYGYMSPTVANPSRSSGMISGGDYKSAVKHFQEMVGLPETGDLDDETETFMKAPRCGIHDKFEEDVDDPKRRKRYVHQGSRWSIKEVTYKITKYPAGIEKSALDAQVKRSFKVWSDVADIRFKKSDNPEVNIEIIFAEGEHGDEDPFDGPGGTLAHAFFPIYGGDVHFDAAEDWTTAGYKGTSFYQVCAHEIGHSLGLSHTKVQNAMMAPVYREMNPNMQLHEDDILAITALYGKSNSIDNTAIDDKTLKQNDMCGGSKSFDAMVTMKSGITFVFRGKKMYELHSDGIVAGYPRNIADEFPGLPDDIDAAFTWFSGKTYILKGDQYWRMENRVVDNGYPKDISYGFPGIPGDIEAALVWSGNSKIYFFKGTEFWKFDPKRPNLNAATKEYPKPIRYWVGIPDHLEAATQYSNGFTYFFKQGKYWRFNDDEFQVAQLEENIYPRRTDEWWFGCKDHEENKRRRLKSSSKPTEDLEIDAQIASRKNLNA